MRVSRQALVFGIAVICLLAVGGLKVADVFRRWSAAAPAGSSRDITLQQSSRGGEALLSAMVQAGNSAGPTSASSVRT
jgi:hypothetical protein